MILSSLNVLWKCHSEGEGDSEQKGTKQIDGVKPGGTESTTP